MKKAIMRRYGSPEDKVAASEFSIEVHHKKGVVIPLSTTTYTYEDVFDYIKDEYSEDLDQIDKVVIQAIR